MFMGMVMWASHNLVGKHIVIKIDGFKSHRNAAH